MVVIVSGFLVSPSGLFLLSLGDHLIDDAVFDRLKGIHDEVAVGVGGDLLDGLVAVLGQDGVQVVLHAEDLLGLYGDVGGLALGAAQGLMDQDAGVGEGAALALGAR